MDCRNCNNIKCFIKRNCLPGWLEYTQVQKTSKLVSAEKRIFSVGDLVNGIYVVCSGKIKVLLSEVGDNEPDIIRIAGDGQIVGHRGFCENMLYPVSAVTLIESEIAFIPNEDFFKLIRANKDLAFYMMMFFADELMKSDQKLRVKSLLSSREKVASAIIMIINAFGYKDEKIKILDLGLSLRELANFASLSQQTLNRVLKILDSEGIIDINESEICIRSEDALRSMAMQDPC